MLYVGDDWSEDHQDVGLVDETGRRLARARLGEGMAGIETGRSPWVTALVASGYQVYAVNPPSVARYRERHPTSGAKSDAGDAWLLAGLVRTDAARHRPVAGDSPAAGGIKVLARSHQRLIWERNRTVLRLRRLLREYFPAALQVFGDLRLQLWARRTRPGPSPISGEGPVSCGGSGI